MQAIERAAERAAVQASKTGNKVRVLVAEDNKVNQEVVLRMLKLEDIYGSFLPLTSFLRVRTYINILPKT